MVTLPGDAYYSRMAASLLTVMNCTELIAETEEHYEAILSDLIANPQKLAQMRAKIEKQRMESPLFNLPRFQKHLELAYKMVLNNHLSGNEPMDIEIPAMPK